MAKIIGTCFICGKPTKLNIHQGCGRDIKTGMGKSEKESNKRSYAKGYIPPFCKD